MKNYLYVSATKVDSLLAQNPELSDEGFLAKAAKLTLKYKGIEASVDADRHEPESNRNRVRYLDRLREYIETSTPCGPFSDGNQFASTIAMTAFLTNNPGSDAFDNDEGESVIPKGVVWFIGSEPSGTRFMLYGSTHHLLGAAKPALGPLANTQMTMTLILGGTAVDVPVAEILDAARDTIKMKCEILAVRHAVRDVGGSPLVIGSPIYVALA